MEYEDLEFAGLAADKASAECIASQLRSLGLEPHFINPWMVMLPKAQLRHFRKCGVDIEKLVKDWSLELDGDGNNAIRLVVVERD